MKDRKLTKKERIHVLTKCSEELAELGAECLKAVNKAITPCSIDKIRDEISDVEKQIKLLKVVLDDLN